MRALPRAWSTPPFARRALPLAAGVAMTGAGWAMMWGTQWRWNPLSFTVLWTGAATLMWSLSANGYPGFRRHLTLAVISVPVWWWFELVNARVRNWEYVQGFDYSEAEWAALSSLAFATVVPAVISAIELVGSWLPPSPSLSAGSARKADVRVARWEVGLGIALQIAVFVFPVQLYPLVWVSPLVVLDGLVALAGGRRLSTGLLRGEWREVVVIAAAGLLCGLLWEFWNYLATPKWVYHIPLLGFARVFEMPTLGYGGYIPFAWSIFKLVRLVDLAWAKIPRRVLGRTATAAVAD